MEAIERETILIKCVEYTNTLLLNKHIAEGEMHMIVLYMHARLNELLAASTTSAGGGAMAAQVARENADRSFEELFKIALARRIVPTHTNFPPLGLTWKTWITKSDTFIVWAGYFHDQNEAIPAADALSRALDLLEVPLRHAAVDIPRKNTSEQSRSRLSLYLALGRNYYQCNHMEKAIRSMEAVFEMNPYHEEARASLGAWFPAKWK
uniref:Uncharacterized protein n=1 Tax=Globisporangium ultimum (strain ATCC 200006 / CBS 805.95 / DAOM BR144) TaxID=431595 RepID=K3WNJ2_GLOUD